MPRRRLHRDIIATIPYYAELYLAFGSALISLFPPSSVMASRSRPSC